MIHFIYLVAFGVFVAVGFGVFTGGSTRDKVITGLKTFAQFLVISLVLAWLLYFIPW